MACARRNDRSDGRVLAPIEHVEHPVAVQDGVRAHEIAIRTMVGLIGVPLTAGIVVLGPRSSSLLFGAAAAIGCSEYYRLTLRSIGAAAWIGIAGAATLPLAPALLGRSAGGALFAIAAAASMLTWTVQLFGTSRDIAPERAGHVLAGLFFSSVGMVALSALRAGNAGGAWTAVVLVACWTNDTAAYFVGSALGRHKLCPLVSPHKTWEGFFAGLAGGIVALLALRPWLPHYFGIEACVALGTLAGLFGPLGDLCKSMLKRAYHVKDAGHLLPGHGGMLDRIDAVLFVAPVVWTVRVTLFPG